MEHEDIAATRFGVKPVGETGFFAGGFVAERERIVPRRETGRNAGDVFGGLLLHADEGVTGRLGLDCAERLGIHEERVIRFTGGKRKFADRHTARDREVDFILRLDSPA